MARWINHWKLDELCRKSLDVVLFRKVFESKSVPSTVLPGTKIPDTMPSIVPRPGTIAAQLTMKRGVGGWMRGTRQSFVDATPKLAGSRLETQGHGNKPERCRAQVTDSSGHLFYGNCSIPYSKTMKSFSVIPVPKAQYISDSSRLQRQPSLCNAIDGSLSISPSSG